ncbi:MAG: 2-oxo acid dehydrogenase subunit E2 [Actinomycetota bacterium]|nr:2-oxo acid dehydrogenase subunit E2 [Actinomycetota bacterium]
MTDITMPQLGETVTEGTITRWAKQVGDPVDENEVLFEVSTEKVDSEVPSPAAGYLSEILVQEGETVDVGTRLAVIGPSAPDQAPAQSQSAESGEAPTAGPSDDVPVEPEDEAPDVAAKAQETGASEVGGTAEAVKAEAARGQAEAARAPEPAAPATGGVGRAGTRPAPAPGPSRGDGTAGGGGSSKLLSPVVRRLIGEHDLDVDQIPGTGSGGRVTRADVLAFVKGREDAPEAATPPAPPVTGPMEETPARRGPAPAPLAAAGPGERDVKVPFSNIRRRTAEHMRRSIETSAHTLVVLEVDYHNVDKVRVPVKERFKAEEGVGLTYLAFIARAVVDAIRDYPHVNSSVGDNELVVHRYVNLGIAVDLDYEGLIVPVVHDAEGKRLRVLAREIAALATSARSKKLSADDISGGTFTITNAGGYGTLITAPIINQPQVAILSTDGVKPRPVALPLGDGGYGIAVHPVGNLALAFDHRAYDGAYASAFMARLKEVLETRDWSGELG